MKFKLLSMGIHDYHEFRKEKLEKLGFKFKPNDKIGAGPMHWWTIISPPQELIEINSLEELMKLIDECGDCIVSKGLITFNDQDQWH